MAGPYVESPGQSPKLADGLISRAESQNENMFNFQDDQQPFLYLEEKKKVNEESNEIEKFAGSLYASSAKNTISNDLSSKNNVSISDT